MRTIAIINQKGGCGKTTTAINLSAMLARAGKRTLLVDLDSQSHCAAGLGIPENKIDMDIGDAMIAAGNKPIDLARLIWQPATNLDLAPSRMRLAGLEAPRGGLANLADKERRLVAAIEQIGQPYDLICIDCAPSIGLLTYNALVAADVVLIPVETSFFSLQGATRQVNTVKSLSRKLGIHRQVWIVPTIHDGASAVANDLLGELYRRFGERVVPVVIRRDVRLREAASFGQSIIDHAPNSQGFEDYAKLADWVIAHWAVAGEVDAALAESLADVEQDLLDSEENSQSGEEQLNEESGDEQAGDEAGDQVGDQAGERIVVTAGQLGGERFAAPIGAMGGQSMAGAGMASGYSAASAISKVNGPQMRPSGAGTGAIGAARSDIIRPAAGTEIKPGGRAEDVARRALELLRRTASSKAAIRPMVPPISMDAPPVIQSPAAAASPASATPEVVLSPSIARLLGAHETAQGVLFVQLAALGQRVAIAGSFNHWSPTAHPMQRNEELGVFELCLRLPAGKWHYRLYVDGSWIADPYNNECEVNQFGEANNVIQIGLPTDSANQFGPNGDMAFGGEGHDGGTIAQVVEGRLTAVQGVPSA